MKKLILLLAATVLLGACKKDNPSKTDLLTASNWRVSAQTHSSVFNSGTPVTVDEFATMQPCERDNFTKFSADNTVVSDEGATKCLATAPQVAPGTWSFSGSYSQLLTVTGTAPNSIPLVYEVVELSATTLRLRYTYSSASGSTAATFVTDITFTAF